MRHRRYASKEEDDESLDGAAKNEATSEGTDRIFKLEEEDDASLDSLAKNEAVLEQAQKAKEVNEAALKKETKCDLHMDSDSGSKKVLFILQSCSFTAYLHLVRKPLV